MTVALRPLARRDLEEIWDYSAARWGVPQANAYLAQLRTTIEALKSNSSLSADAGHLKAGLRKARSGSHLIYFHVAEGIDVVRILHERRDAGPVL